jgi:hypothetical protein
VQVGGAARDALAFVRSQLAIELNAHHDNPIITPAEDRIISVGSYEALPVAAALDFLRIALAPVLTGSLERAMKLLQTPLSGLPGGLSEQEGLQYGGLGAISWSAHALTAEARLLAQPRARRALSFPQAVLVGVQAQALPIPRPQRGRVGGPHGVLAPRLTASLSPGPRWAVVAVRRPGQRCSLSSLVPSGRLSVGGADAHARNRHVHRQRRVELGV